LIQDKPCRSFEGFIGGNPLTLFGWRALYDAPVGDVATPDEERAIIGDAVIVSAHLAGPVASVLTRKLVPTSLRLGRSWSNP
jgi:hypothetical protein